VDNKYADPVVEKVTFLGAKHLSDEELAALTGVRPGAPLDPEANRAACRAVVSKFNDMGRPYAACELLRGGKPGDKEVVFYITEGRRAPIRDISFAGGGFLHASSLADFPTFPIPMFHPVPPSTTSFDDVDAAASKVEALYHLLGYTKARVRIEVQDATEPGGVSVTVRVWEGRRELSAPGPCVADIVPEHLTTNQRSGVWLTSLWECSFNSADGVANELTLRLLMPELYGERRDHALRFTFGHMP
jgi:hypothetical protein